MGALLVLSLRDNSLYAAGAKALGEGLKGNQAITELDLAGNRMGVVSGEHMAASGMSGIITLAETIKDNGALLVLSLESNDLYAAGGKALAEGLKGNQQPGDHRAQYFQQPPWLYKRCWF
jgi:hypothetical protein